MAPARPSFKSFFITWKRPPSVTPILTPYLQSILPGSSVPADLLPTCPNTSTPSLDREPEHIIIVITLARPPFPFPPLPSPKHWPPPPASSHTANADPDSHVPGRAKLNVKCMVGPRRLHCAEGESGRRAASLLLSADRV